MNKLINALDAMKSSKVENYVIAGLDSYLLENGNVRLFKNSRNHQDSITPHSHRFDFTCLVLQGFVVNHVWNSCAEPDGDLFESSKLIYSGDMGDHAKSRDGRDYYNFDSTRYEAGDTYSMLAEQLHSINFSKGAIVLFFEGEQKSDESYIIEPVVSGSLIPTYESKKYMFIKD
tara:strand:+ start:129 stop:650 length:522 start_codon:yes stop_codon:yes gene_type:complete